MLFAWLLEFFICLLSDIVYDKCCALISIKICQLFDYCIKKWTLKFCISSLKQAVTATVTKVVTWTNYDEIKLSVELSHKSIIFESILSIFGILCVFATDCNWNSKSVQMGILSVAISRENVILQ